MRPKTAGSICTEIRGIPDGGIKQELRDNSLYIVIVQEMKNAAFFIGANCSSNIMLCRLASGSAWSASAGVVARSLHATRHARRSRLASGPGDL
jgi:hypothetical protein